MHRLDEVENEIIILWEELAEARGFDRIVGRIIITLLIDGVPLSQQALAEKTGYSIPTISKTLKTLSSLGSVRKMKQPGKRLTLYSVDMRPPDMLSGALRSWVAMARMIERRITLIGQKLDQAQEMNPERAEKLRKIVMEFTASIPKMIDVIEKVMKGTQLD